MTKYICVAGHGRKRNGQFDPGAGGFVKKGENRYMVNDLFPAMKKYANNNFVFIDAYNLYDYGNIAFNNRWKKSLKNTYGNDIAVIEFHYDASSSQSAYGGHVIVHAYYSPDEMDLKLRNVIKDNLGVRYNHKGQIGISGRTGLGNTNRAKAGNVNYRLLELGFGTNKSNANTLQTNTDKLAKELVEAIQGTKALGKPVIISPPKTPVNKPAVSKLSQPNKKANLTVDGWWGDATTKALQVNLGTLVDGVISGQYKNNVTLAISSCRFNTKTGSSMIVALQRKIGAKADGFFGPASVKALQKYLGTYQDGVISKPSAMVKELQRRLNAGTF